jgi:hypothetical protein
VIDSFDNALAVGNFYLEGEPTEFVFVTVSASGEPAKTARFMSNSSGVDLVPLDAAASLVRVTGVLGQLFVADPGVSVGGDLLEVEAGGTLFLADYRVNPAAKRFLRGDVDANGVIDVTDPTIVLNYLFSSGPAPSCLDAADANDDGALDLSDGVHLLNYLFEGGEAPVGLPLGPSVDATIDSLTCNALQP